MTETEAKLRREVLRLEAEKDELLKKLQQAEELNFKTFRENRELSYYIQQMERCGV